MAKGNRIVLTDGSGRWFDGDGARTWEEDADWNGHNHISRATGSQWEHETLFHTKGKKWILHHWSQRDGTLPSWVEITAADAAKWLSANNCDVPEECSAEYAGLEIR